MFAIDHWVEWTSQRILELKRDRAEGTFRIAEVSRGSDELALWVDLDTDRIIGRISVWPDGSYDVEAIEVATQKTIDVAGWPNPVNDQTFEEVLDRFVALVAPDG